MVELSLGWIESADGGRALGSWSSDELMMALKAEKFGVYSAVDMRRTDGLRPFEVEACWIERGSFGGAQAAGVGLKLSPSLPRERLRTWGNVIVGSRGEG